MTSRKFVLTLTGIGILALVALGFLIAGQFEPVLWGTWFVAFTGTLAVYAGANVIQKNLLK